MEQIIRCCGQHLREVIDVALAAKAAANAAVEVRAVSAAGPCETCKQRNKNVPNTVTYEVSFVGA